MMYMIFMEQNINNSLLHRGKQILGEIEWKMNVCIMKTTTVSQSARFVCGRSWVLIHIKVMNVLLPSTSHLEVDVTGYFGKDFKNQGPVSRMAWHLKKPFLHIALSALQSSMFLSLHI